MVKMGTSSVVKVSFFRYIMGTSSVVKVSFFRWL